MTTPKRAIYPGSFDPITKGHVDIITRAQRQFDEVIIALFENIDKEPLFTFEQRLEMIKLCFSDNKAIKVVVFKGLLADFAKQENCFTIIRGLRALSDFDYEFQLALTNRSLDHNIDTVFFMTDLKYAFLSSSTVRQMLKFGANVRAYVPTEVETWLNNRYG